MNEIANPPVALVTGGSKGIGRAICIEMAKSGYQVIVNYLSDADGASETLSLIEQQGGRGICLPFDVSDYAATQLAMEKIFATYASSGRPGQQRRPHCRRAVRHDDTGQVAQRH